jgi:ABC-2 type transport system permease protein
MKKILIIIQREYITRVRKRAFVIATLLTPIGFFGFIAFSVLMAGYSDSHKKVAIIDESGIFRDVTFPDAEDGSVSFSVEKNMSAITADPKEKSKQKYDAIIEIPANYDIEHPNKTSISCISEKNIGMTATGFINKTFSEKLRQIKAKSFNLDQEKLDDLNKEVRLTYHKLSEEDSKSTNAEIGVIFGNVIGFGMYILLIVYGTMIMRGVMEEKSNRIMEVLVSSAKPMQLMLGKIIGISAVGLTQFILWIILITTGTIFGLPLLGITASHHAPPMHSRLTGAEVDPDAAQHIANVIANNFHFGPIVIVLFIFFLGGFLLYGSLFAAIGAAGGDDNDSQSLVFPVMIPIIITVAMMNSVLNQPEGPLAFWMTVIPFSSPIIMPALMPTNPPLWQILLSIVCLFGGFILCASIAAKIYRTGILMYGKKTTFREIGRWIFARN